MGSHNKIALSLNLGTLLYGQEVRASWCFQPPSCSVISVSMLVHTQLLHFTNTSFPVTFLGQKDWKKKNSLLKRAKVLWSILIKLILQKHLTDCKFSALCAFNLIPTHPSNLSSKDVSSGKLSFSLSVWVEGSFYCLYHAMVW